MKRKRGCGMRSVLGFLSQRGLEGDPHVKEDFQRRRLQGSRNLYKKDLLGHFGCVNAIEFSNNGGQMLVSGGDDRRVLLWHMERAIHSRIHPIQLKGEHHSNIFCLAFNNANTRVFSGGNDEQVILHDVESGASMDVFSHEDAVYGLSVSPVNDNVFASSSDDGRVLIWDIRESLQGDPFCLANYPSAFHSVMFNPVEPRLLATANSKEGVGLWDIRKPNSSLLRYGGNLSLQSAMSVRFNSSGTQLLALRRRLPPVLYDIHSRLPVFQFDNQGYFNSCTMKSCCFAGDRDQYVLSGSDDFNLYMWKIPTSPDAGGVGRVVNGAFMVLKGHRSIVNQVRFNPQNYMICSSGVEKVIKIWSPYKQPNCTGDLDGRREDDSRSLYTHEEYIGLVLNSSSSGGSSLSHDYASQSIHEDPRMMAFFDSLVRREIEGWSSDSDSDSTFLQLHTGVSERSGYSDSESSTSLPHSPQPTAEEPDQTAFNLGAMLSREFSAARKEMSSRQQRLANFRRHKDKRLQARTESDSYDEACETEVEADLFPRPRSPSPEEVRLSSSSSSSSSNSSSSSSSTSEDEEDLNERRALTRQRNAMRRRPKPKKEEKPNANAENATAYIGEDTCDYPQIKVDDLSSSPTSSPARSSTEVEVVKAKPSPRTNIESVERKIYKAYKWLQNSCISYSARKDGESSHGHQDDDEGRPGASARNGTAPPVNEVHDSSLVDRQVTRDLLPEGWCKESVNRCVLFENSSNGPSPCCESERQSFEAQGSTSHSASTSPFEHNQEVKILNGKSVCKESNRCPEEPLSLTVGRKQQRNCQNSSQSPKQHTLVVPKDSFASTMSHGSSSCPRTQTDVPEDRGVDPPCVKHNNGQHPFPSFLNSNGQSCSEPGVDVTGLLVHSNTDHDTLVETGALLLKDCCVPEVDLNTISVSTNGEISVLREFPQNCGELKRHRVELDDSDSESSSPEKKLKT
ncbi:DDB1- and CUL4-associated factor 5 isoform X2 [Ambystoma mexicanum]|uniref:DDB1- and CUL4-associated factor 5 isoform X2 n=1 Tax=Ambystoma mexicanum TaxID=8296 RepID=UPI0037E71087